ncbi:hypothetical protein NQ318_017156, partial [Aromia moschata]
MLQTFRCRCSFRVYIPSKPNRYGIKIRRNVTVDNFFTSIDLAAKLLHEHQLIMIGTLRKNKPQIPLEFTTIKRPEKTSMFGYQDKLTLCSYIQRKNKNVLMLSSMHFDDDLDPSTGKPDMKYC